MLKPAILYKEEIVKKSFELFYSKDYMYYMGTEECWPINIRDNSEYGEFQYAVLNKDEELVGYIAYRIDWHSLRAYNFGLISFKKGDLTVPKELDKILTDLIEYTHMIEWHAIADNPATKAYDHFMKKYNGCRYEIHDVFKDKYGDYHNMYTYEVRGKK